MEPESDLVALPAFGILDTNPVPVKPVAIELLPVGPLTGVAARARRNGDLGKACRFVMSLSGPAPALRTSNGTEFRFRVEGAFGAVGPKLSRA